MAYERRHKIYKDIIEHHHFFTEFCINWHNHARKYTNEIIAVITEDNFTTLDFQTLSGLYLDSLQNFSI